MLCPERRAVAKGTAQYPDELPDVRIMSILLLVGSWPVAQDTSVSSAACAAVFTTAATSVTIQKIQGEYTSDASSNCKLDSSKSDYPSQHVGAYVEVSGIVTAAGTQKDVSDLD